MEKSKCLFFTHGVVHCVYRLIAMCVGDVQTILLRPEPHIQLFCPDLDAHLTRALHGHQASDVEPSFRWKSDSSRRRDWQRVAAEWRLFAAVADRLRRRHNGPRHSVLLQYSAAPHSRLRHGQFLRPLCRSAHIHDLPLRPNFHHFVALQHRSVVATHQSSSPAAWRSSLRAAAAAAS